jgi:pilus assembly protein Flp/PilA
MNAMISRVRQFLTSEDGPTAVEYAVMLALIVVAIVGVVGQLGRLERLVITFPAERGHRRG